MMVVFRISFFSSCWQHKVASSHMMFVWVYLGCVIKLLSWSFIHLINNSALEVERRDPVSSGTCW